MLTAAGSALVAGNTQEGIDMAMEMRKVRANRAFYVSGKPIKVGETVDVSKVFAMELVYIGKASYVEEAAKEEPKKGAK